MNFKQMREITTFLPKIEKYISESKNYFSDLKKFLDDENLSDSDKVICIKNQLREFENNILSEELRK